MSGGQFQLLLAEAPPIQNVTGFGTLDSVTQSGSTVTFTTTAPIRKGALAIIAVFEAVNTPQGISSISDGTNSYSQVADSGTISFNRTVMWYCANCQAVNSGATVTITFAGSTGGNRVQAVTAQVDGVFPTTPLDRTASNTSGSGNPPSISTGVMSQANEIVFGATGCDEASSGSYSTSSGFTNASTVNNTVTAIGLDYQIVKSTASVAYASTVSTADRGANVLGAFKGF